MIYRVEIVDMKIMGCDSIYSVSVINNPNKYCVTYCMGLGTSVSFLL